LTVYIILDFWFAPKTAKHFQTYQTKVQDKDFRKASLAHVRETLSALQHELSAPRVAPLSRAGPEPPPKPTEIGYDHLLVAVPLNVHSVSAELYRERVLESPKIHALPPTGRTRIKSAQNRERNCSTCSVCGHLKYIGAFKKYHQHPSACIVPLEERCVYRYSGWCVCEQSRQTAETESIQAPKRLRLTIPRKRASAASIEKGVDLTLPESPKHALAVESYPCVEKPCNTEC
jgi:hypothetical protein